MRPIPDENIVKRAFKVLEKRETPMENYLREEHTAMISAARIGMDASRKVWPLEADHLHPDLHPSMAQIHQGFENLYVQLDAMAHNFHGELVQKALCGTEIEDELEEAEEKLGIGRFGAQAAPPIGGDLDPQPRDVE